MFIEGQLTERRPKAVEMSPVRERESRRRKEEKRIRERELVYTDLADEYKQFFHHLKFFLQYKDFITEDMTKDWLSRVRLFEKEGGVKIVGLKDDVRTFLQSLEILKEDPHGLSRFFQAIGRRNNMVGVSGLENSSFFLVSLAKYALEDQEKTSGDFEVWLDQSSISKIEREFNETIFQPSHFFRHDMEGYREIGLPETIQKRLPAEFFTDPTNFIEALPSPNPLHFEAPVIASLRSAPYDSGRVKFFDGLIFKRVDVSSVVKGTEEIERAKNLQEELTRAGSDIKIPVFHGVVYDHGNIYLVQERIPNSINLAVRVGYDHVLQQFSGIMPVNRSNVLVQYKTQEMLAGEEIGFWLVDFEADLSVLQEEEKKEQEIPRTHAPRLERAPDISEIETRSRRYEQQGLTVEFAQEIPDLVEEKHRDSRYFDLNGHEHLEVFYLNFSDPLELIQRQVDVRNEHVCLVGGSGDFAKVFLDRGANRLDIFDISPAAVFYNELSLVALRELDFASCQDFINFWKIRESQSGIRRETLSIFDPNIYQALRSFLSEPARVYFDELVQRPDLFRCQGEYFRGFAQLRKDWSAKTQRFTTLLGDLVQDEASYLALQKKARATTFTFSLASARAMVELIARANGVDDFPQLSQNEREALLPEAVGQAFTKIDSVYLRKCLITPFEV